MSPATHLSHSTKSCSSLNAECSEYGTCSRTDADRELIEEPKTSCQALLNKGTQRSLEQGSACIYTTRST